MKKTTKFLFVFFVIIFAWNMNAQEKKITGTITTAVDYGTLPGVTVIVVEDPTNGALSDFDGNYVIEASVGQTLEFSFLGMKTKTVVIGTADKINVEMSEDAAALDEVVITALGIAREEKTLTYANQTVQGNELTKTKDVNFVNSLQGKAAGVEVRQSSSGPGGSTKIQIRGSKSVSGDSSPLFVIDGIPMQNNRGSQPGVWDGVDGGDGLSALNPEDIESMSILKGANAAILYGSQGANGVIVITTKSGREGAATVHISSAVTIRSIIELPDLQFDYGSEGGAKESWSYTKGDYASDYVKDYFDTGVDFLNSVSVSGGNATTQAYFSYGNVSSTGVTPGNKYVKNNFSFKQSTKLFNDQVKVSSNVILSKENTTNRNRSGYYNNPLTGLYWFPRDRDFNEFKENYSVFNADRNVNEQNWFVQDHHQTNPYWLLNEESQEDEFLRAIVSANIEYTINDRWKVQARGSFDFANKTFDNQRHAGGNTTTVAKNGRWIYQDYTDSLTYLDGIATYNNTWGDFTLNALLGGSYQKTVYGDGVGVNSGMEDTGLLFANEFYFQNLGPTVQVNSTLTRNVEKQSLFGNFEFGWKDMLYVDIAGRNDWASTLAETGNESYFYPSFGLTWIPSVTFEMPDWISFLKARGSYAQVGNEVPWNVISPDHRIDNTGSVIFNTVKPFTNAKPEIINTFEIGIDWRMFDNRLGIDFTYYDIVSKDQFLQFPLVSTLYTSEFINAGEITNTGVEIVLKGKPIVGDNFVWRTMINYSRNTNKIVELSDSALGTGQGGSEGFRVQMVEGGSVGDIYAFKFLRDDEGRIILDDDSGRPLKTSTRELIGNAEPDYVLGWQNDFDYKSWTFSLQINAKVGGFVGSQSEALFDGNGVSGRSGAARDRGYENIFAVQNGQTVTQIDPFTYYDAIGGRNGIDEPHIYDRTSVRLAQFLVSYNFNTANVDWLKNASLAFVGNNLFYFYKDAPFDPELTQGTGRNDPGMDNYNLPATRNYGLSLNLTF